MTDKERVSTLLSALEEALEIASQLKEIAKYDASIEGLELLESFAQFERDRLNQEKEGK